MLDGVECWRQDRHMSADGRVATGMGRDTKDAQMGRIACLSQGGVCISPHRPAASKVPDLAVPKIWFLRESRFHTNEPDILSTPLLQLLV